MKCIMHFFGCENLTTITNIHNGVNIMFYTFGRCVNLVNAPIIPNSVNNMTSTFASCPNLVDAPDIPNSVINMYSTFYNCNNLVNAPIIPNSVNNMTSTFCYCHNLVNAPIIPNSVNNMDSTFASCSNMSGDIYILSNQINQAKDCFNGTSKVKNVYVPMVGNYGGEGIARSSEKVWRYSSNSQYLNCWTSQAYSSYSPYPRNESADKIFNDTQYYGWTNNGITIYTTTTNLASTSEYIHIAYNTPSNISLTYFTFLLNGYDTNGTTNGVYLKDINNSI